MSHIKAIIFDIEGTICPISFVKDNLYTYFLRNIPGLMANYKFPMSKSEEVSDEIYKTLQRLSEDKSNEGSKMVQSKSDILGHFETLVKKDIKDSYLKEIQGFVWAKGYKDGEIKVNLFPDAIEFIERQQSAGKSLYIYSSGSIKAQKLLLGSVLKNGSLVDLNSKFSGYFDITTAGYKWEQSSYTKIYEAVKQQQQDQQLKSSEIVFFSDNILEIRAASQVGMATFLVEKPGNKPVSEQEKLGVASITSFDEVTIV